MAWFGRLKVDIVGTLAPVLADLGFVPKRGTEKFVRTAAPGVSHGYQLIINESAPYAKLDVHLSVRIDAVEKVFHRTSGYEKKYQKETPTMGGALDAITGDPAFKMLLDSDGGPASARNLLFAPPMLAFYADWYARFSTLPGIDHELNDDPRRETPNRPMPWLRCSTGVIVSHFLRRPAFPTLAAEYSQIMQQVSGGFYWPRFQALLKDLQESTP